MRISCLNEHKGRYIIATDTPDKGWSTFPECWGAGAMSARAVAATDELGEAVLIAESWGRKYCTIIDRKTGREVGKAKLAELEKS